MARTIVLSTCGTQREAQKIAHELIRRRLAACVNVLPVNSCYRWKKRIVNGREWLMVIKTNSNVFARLTKRILAVHSYELPEIVSLKIDDGFRPYLEWLDSELLSGK